MPAVTTCLWFTGRAGSGKTTVAAAVTEELRRRGCPVAFVDAPDARAFLSGDDPLAALLWLARLLGDAGVVAVVAVDEPRRAVRDRVRATIPEFAEIYVDGGPGADDYEEPYAPDLRVPTHDRAPGASAAQVVSWLEDRGVVPPGHDPAS